jgi:hypothetical protein
MLLFDISKELLLAVDQLNLDLSLNPGSILCGRARAASF